MSEKIPRRLRRFQRKKEMNKLKTELKKIKAKEKPFSKEKIAEEIIQQIEGKKELPEAFYNRISAKNKNELMPHAIHEVKTFRERHERFPKGKEVDEIAESLYKQIKAGKIKVISEPLTKKTRHSEEKKHGRRERKETGFAAIEPTVKKTDFKSLSVEDLFSEKKGKTEKKLGLGELEKNLSIEKESLRELKELKDIDNLTQEIETDKNICPNCGNKTEEIIFCPECGTGFCPHCALQAKDLGQFKKFVCPKCKKEVKVKK